MNKYLHKAEVTDTQRTKQIVYSDKKGKIYLWPLCITNRYIYTFDIVIIFIYEDIFGSKPLYYIYSYLNV